MQDSLLGELSTGVNTSVNGRNGPSIFSNLRILWARVSEKGQSRVSIGVPFQEGIKR